MTNHRIIVRLLFILVFAVLAALVFNRANEAQTTPAAQATSKRCEMSFPLPNPSHIGATKFEKLLYLFLEQGCYRSWVSDNSIRNTGPFINGASFGTHNAVKIFYSPEVWDWLKVRNRRARFATAPSSSKKCFPIRRKKARPSAGGP
jgi:hypothetical protein